MKPARSLFHPVLVVAVLCALLASTRSAVLPAAAQSHAAPAQGGQPPAGPPGQMSQEEMQKMMALASPGAKHKELDRLVGTWKTTITMWMGPGDPTHSSGTATYEWVLGGRYLKSKQTGQFGDMPFEGLGMDGYDNAQKHYFSVWFDNMGTGVMLLTGQPSADGKGIDYSGTTFDPMQMKNVRVREEVRWTGATKYLFTMYTDMPGPDGKPRETRMMEITAEKL
jgi:hypothetical protein